MPVHLGLGLSHRFIVEGEFGYSYDRPIRHLREYLETLHPLLRGEKRTSTARRSRPRAR